MAEETMQAFDLTKVDDSDIMTQPFSLSDTDPIISEKKSNVMTGDEFSKLGKISSSWNDPAWKKTSASEVFGTEKVDLTKPEEFIASTSQGFIDEIANFPDKIKNETAQIVMEGYQDKNKLTQRLIGYISNVLPKLPVGTQPDELVKKIVDKSDVFKPEYDEKLVNTLDGREYPLVEWARKTLSNTTKAIQDRDLARVLQAEQRGIDRDAWSNQIGTTIGAMMPVIALGKGVGGISKALGATAETASKVGATAMKAGTLAQMTGDYAYTTAAQYLDKTGDSDFTNFTPEDAKGLSALGYGAIGTMIEYGFGGVEPLFASGMEKLGTSNILKAVGKTMAGEAWEEFLQEWEEFLFRNADGTNTRTWGETLKDSLKSAVYGGLIGGVVGDVAYRTNRRNIANALMKTGMDYGTAIKIADTVIEDTGQEIFKRADENLSLTNKVGESFNKLQGNIKVALETAGWSDNIIDPTTQQPMNIDTYSNIMAADISSQIVRQASLSGLSPNEFMDVSQFQAIDNVVYLKPLGTKADIKSQIDAQDFIIKRQRELKKTGAGDSEKLKLAQMRKNILKKAYDIKEYQEKRAKERIKRQTTLETAQEIETATKDVETVKGTTQAEFDSKVDTENLTSAEKSKRYGNAVLKSILPTKTDFDAVMVDPMYANAKQATIAVADRINSFIKAHRTYGLKTDIANALKKMQTVNQGNFIDSVTTPDLDGVDVIAENAFLYHFLFSDATTIQTYLDSYITRAEDSLNQKKGKLSKKDLVGQSFKATDNAMQTQAQVIGAEYTSIYNEDGSYADKNVMAVMLSYQNQFVQEQPKVQPIENWGGYTNIEIANRQIQENLVPVFNELKKLTNKDGVIPESSDNALKAYDLVKNTDFKPIVNALLLKYDIDQDVENWLYSKDIADDLIGYGKDESDYQNNLDAVIQDMNEEDPDGTPLFGVLDLEETTFTKSDYNKDLQNLMTKYQEKGDIALYMMPKSVDDLINKIFKHIAIKYMDATGNVDLSFDKIYKEKPAQQFLFQEQFDLADENARLDDIYPAYDGETIEVDGKERTVYNSNGDRIAKSKEALTNFWNWFGDSKVVDEQGRPLVVYHGSKSVFDTFDNTVNQTKERQMGADLGYFFTDSEYVANKFRTKEQQLEEAGYYIENTVREPVSEEKYDAQGRYLGSVHYIKATLPPYKNFGLYKVYLKAENIVEYQGESLGVWDVRESALKSAKASGKDGMIIYKADTGGGIANEYIVFESNQIKSVDNRGTYSADTGNIYYQDDVSDKELVVTHGISLNSLEKSLDLGGLPMPSIAITKATAPLTDFGSISLIGTKNMIDPSNPANKVYDRDIWSITFPTKTYKNAKRADVSKFRDKFNDAFKKADDLSRLDGSILYYASQSSRPEEAVDGFVYSDGAKLYYIENVLGEKFDVPTYDKAKKILDNSMIFVKADEQFIEEISKIDLNKIDRTDDLDAVIMQPIQDLLNRFDFDSEYGDKAKVYEEHARQYYSGDKFNFQNKYHLVQSIKEYVRSNGEYEVDKLELSKLLDAKITNDANYEKWATKQVEDLLGEPKVSVGKKLEDWTLENIAKSMIKNAGVNAQKSLVYGSGKVIASGAKKLSSIQEIKEIGKNLKSKEDASQDIEKIQDAMDNYTSQFMTSNDITYSLNQKEEAYMALGRAASAKKPTKETIQSALNYEFGKKDVYDDKILEEGLEIVKAIQNLSRHYFEAKPQRIVRIEEFVGAVVPTDERYNEISVKLSERGLKVVRTDNLQNGILDLEQSVGNVLFQGKKANGFYDPELGVIVLGRNMNEMTLPHEMQHYWLDKIFNIYKRAKSGELQVRDEWLTETKALFDMLGIDENQTQLTQGQQEKFARMSEAYLTGIGVTGDMNATFKEYQQWVPEKYKSILNLGYLSDDGKIEYPFLDQGAVDFFNKWYANYSLPSLATSPERQEFINPEDENGEVLPVSIKEMNNRDKEFGNDAEEQVKTDQRLYNTLDENMPAEIKIEADGQKVVQASRSNFLKESEKQQRRWFERKSRDAEAQLAQDYIEKNPEHAKEVIFGDPELIPNDTGIDRATLINAYMALNNITPESEDWATLHTNIAINQSLAGTQLALSNNTSYRTYLDALREIENAREMKAATNYAGAKQGAVERFNRDIQRFVDEELPKVLATAPNTEARDIALKSLFERARTKFGGNTTGGVLNQMDFDYARGQKGASAAFTRWAVNQIKKDAGAKLNGQEQAHLLNLSAKAQQAVIDLDDRDVGKAVAGAQEIRKWQVEKDKLMGVKPQKFSLFGDWAPRAMLASFNTLVVSNIPSTAMNTAVVRMLESGIFGKNEVSKSLTDSEIKRIKAIYGATAMNLAQMEKPTSPSLLHGEKYSSSGQKWYDPFTILGKEDNWFRVPTFVNTLARIATQDAKTTGKSADDVFKEYCRLENQSDAAKLARKQALAVSNMAVFTQDGALARSLNGIRDWINQGSRALVGLDPKGFGLGNLLSPFLKTGANIAEMGIRGSLAPITTISALAQKWRSGKAIDPMKNLALAMDWTYFLSSALMVSLLAALTSDDDEFYTEPYEMGKTYDPDKPYDSINIAGVWIDLDFFGPFAIPMRTACRLIKQWKTDNLAAIYKGYGQGLKYAAMDTPLLESVFNNQMSYAAKKPEDWAAGYAYTQVNKLVPSQIKPLSRAISRGAGTQFDIGLGKVVERKFHRNYGKVVERKFHRNYGFDGAELTTQDLIDIFTTRITWQP